MPTSTTRSPRVQGWSLLLGRPFGVDVYVHVTFLILLTWLMGAEIVSGRSPSAAMLTVTFVALVFVCVVLHELGHALAARRYGIGTKDITLYPIGGIARLEKMPSNPHHEFVIAIAGPLVNVGIAVLLVALLLAVPATGSFGEFSADAGPLLPRLMITNIFLAAFNLIPAFPMDGGRVLRALLSRRMGRSRATTTAARVGQALAVAFGVLGLVAYPMLLIIALFVWLGGAAEARAEELHEAIDGLPVGRAMETRFDVLRPDTPLDDARGLVMAGSQIDFPVLLADGRIVGLVGREAIAEGLAAFGPAAPVTAVMTRQGPTVSVTEDLQSALERLSGQAWRTVPVVDQRGMLVGLLSVENLSELLMFRKAYLVDPVPSRAT